MGEITIIASSFCFSISFCTFFCLSTNSLLSKNSLDITHLTVSSLLVVQCCLLLVSAAYLFNVSIRIRYDILWNVIFLQNFFILVGMDNPCQDIAKLFRKLLIFLIKGEAGVVDKRLTVQHRWAQRRNKCQAGIVLYRCGGAHARHKTHVYPCRLPCPT